MKGKDFFCYNCGKIMNKNNNKCSCGWEKLIENIKDNRCFFSLGGKRCPLPGTIFDSCKEGGQGYCRYHCDRNSDLISSKNWLDFIFKNYKSIIHYRLCDYYRTGKYCEQCLSFEKKENDARKNNFICTKNSYSKSNFELYNL